MEWGTWTAVPQKMPAGAGIAQPLRPLWFPLTSGGLNPSLVGSTQPSWEQLIASPQDPYSRAPQPSTSRCGPGVGEGCSAGKDLK